MTQEEKAIAYDKALEKIQNEERLNHMTSREIKYYLFPELIEDDDEKVRKQLVEFLDNIWYLGKNANFDKYDKSDCANWIDWIEKHKKTEK